MPMSFWEFRAATLRSVSRDAAWALERLSDGRLEDVAELIDGDPDAFPEGSARAIRDVIQAVDHIEQMCFESDVADEDGTRLSDDEIKRRLTERYGEPRPLILDAEGRKVKR